MRKVCGEVVRSHMGQDGGDADSLGRVYHSDADFAQRWGVRGVRRGVQEAGRAVGRMWNRAASG